MFEHDAPCSGISNTPLSYHDAIVAFADWFENNGFDVDFRVTPLRLPMAAVVFGLLQLVFMVFFRDNCLLQKVSRGFCRGVYSVSIPHSLLFSLRTFTNYRGAGFEGILDIALGRQHVLHV
jgi:hypothetical protein